MTMLLNKLISMVDQTKIDLKMSRWIHMPKDSEEYEYYKFLCGSCEAYAYNNLGAKSQLDSSEEVSQLGIKSWKKAHAIYNLVGMKDEAQKMDTMITAFTSKKPAEALSKQTANDASSFF